MSKYVTQVQRSTTFQLAEPPFSKEGYKLVGWNDDSDKTANPPKYSAGQTIEGGFDQNTRLYARWGIDMSGAWLTISPTAYVSSDNLSTYTWQSLRPTASVLSGSVPLVQGVDYELRYAGDSGTITHEQEGTIVSSASVSAIGIGDFTGTLTAPYTVSHTYNMLRYSFSGTGEGRYYYRDSWQTVPQSRTEYEIFCRFEPTQDWVLDQLTVNDDDGSRTIPDASQFAIKGNATATATTRYRYSSMTVKMDVNTTGGEEIVTLTSGGDGYFGGSTSAGGAVSYSIFSGTFTAYKPCGWSEIDSKFTVEGVQLWAGFAMPGTFDPGYRYGHKGWSGQLWVTAVS